jgi:hypothetical protein
MIQMPAIIETFVEPEVVREGIQKAVLKMVEDGVGRGGGIARSPLICFSGCPQIGTDFAS